MTAPKQILIRGFIAGLIGATVLAVWFLVIDTIQGRPFFTPAFLASVLADVHGAERSLTAISVYTLIHYSAFSIVGILVAWLYARLESCPSVLLGLVIGFVLFDLVFYLSVVLTGVDVVNELGWPLALSGNLLAGVGLTLYLHTSLPVSSPSWLQTLSRHRIVREGLVAGVLGAIVVAVWFLIVDLVRGQLFFTPGALGSALFLRVTDATQVQVNGLTVGAYTIAHFAAFALVGLLAAAIAIGAERAPPLLLAGLLIFVTFEAFFLGALAVMAEWLLGALGWVSIGFGNLLATVGMAFFLWNQHPELREIMGERAFTPGDTEAGSKEVEL